MRSIQIQCQSTFDFNASFFYELKTFQQIKRNYSLLFATFFVGNILEKGIVLFSIPRDILERGIIILYLIISLHE